MNNIFKNNRVKNLWKALKPWLTGIAIFLILQYSGAMSGISALTNSALLETGIMDADPESSTSKAEVLDYNFTITSLDGKPVDFNSFRGKTVFLNLWATWCGPCRAEMPSIERLYSKTDHDSVAFVILSLDTENLPEKVSRYINQKSYTFPVYVADRGLPVQLQVRSIPTTFVVSKDGRIVYKKSGVADYDTKAFKNYLEKLAGKD